MSLDFDSLKESLLECLSGEPDKEERRRLVNTFFDHVYQLTGRSVLDFNKGLEWINVTEPLSLETHLKGKIVVLDFFTYCCINCMHILPDLKALEKRFPVEDGLVVVGVHSPKFSNEKETANVASAVARYEITHPVVSDPEETMWRALNVCCWPTLIVLGPKGEPILELMGEGHRELLELFIEEAIAFYSGKGEISRRRIEQLCVKQQVAAESPIRFPGKVVVDHDLVAIADTGNHRVLITNKAGQVQHIIGGTQPGFRDGNFSEARFWSVQGIAFRSPNLLYISDTENHSIREVDLCAKTVKTVSGTGKQGSDRIGGKLWKDQAISSPWDVCFVNENVLLIAMAGTHQIWALFLEDTTWWKNRTYKKGTCVCVAGNGREENCNNTYPMSASFAQPSGLSYSKQLNCVFVADSESSTVRRLQLTDGHVMAVVGGALDRKNLFSFGDLDGTGMEAKLQHPLCVAWSEKTSQVYVADSYNHKVKCVDPSTKKCSSLGDLDSFKLNEPGGLCVDGDDLYLADTNNHRILVINTRTKKAEKFDLKMGASSEIANNLPLLVCERTVAIPADEERNIVLRINISAPTGASFPSENMIRWEPILPSGSRKVEIQNKKIEGSTAEWTFNVLRFDTKVSSARPSDVMVTCRAPICSGQTCSSWKGTFRLSIIPDDVDSSGDNNLCDIKYQIS